MHGARQISKSSDVSHTQTGLKLNKLKPYLSAGDNGTITRARDGRKLKKYFFTVPADHALAGAIV